MSEPRFTAEDYEDEADILGGHGFLHGQMFFCAASQARQLATLREDYDELKGWASDPTMPTQLRHTLRRLLDALGTEG